MAGKAAAEFGVPLTADGRIPPAAGAVVTPDGPGTVRWCTAPPHSASRGYPGGAVWHTLVAPAGGGPPVQWVTSLLQVDTTPASV